MNKEIFRRLVELKAERQVGRYLQTLSKKGKLPKPVFEGAFNVLPGVAYEVVALNDDWGGRPRVFLTKRDENDKYWPGMWHCPGTMIFNNDFLDDRLSGAWERLRTTEFGSKELGNPDRVRVLFLNTTRGKEVAVVHLLMVPGDLQNGRFFSTADLPENLINHHRSIIGAALRRYYRLDGK